MPAANFKKSEPLSERVKVQLTPAQRLALEARAEATGVTLAAYMRNCALVTLDGPQAVKPLKVKRKRDHDLAFAEIHELAMQVRRVGNNFNQLAHQANAGLVPIKREEIVYVMNQIQVVLSQSVAAVERAFHDR